MTQYNTFWEAYLATHPDSPYTPAKVTWTPQALQQLADAYSAKNPTWTPPAAQNAALPQPIQPVKFDPMGDLTYAGTASAGQLSLDHANAERDYQYGRGQQTFGYDQYGNPVTSGPNLNPYSEAAILKRNYDNSVRGTTNSYAASGQLYSGALKNAQGQNDYSYGQASDQLQRTAGDFYHGQNLNVRNTSDNYLMTLAQALGPAFQNFLIQQKGGS